MDISKSLKYILFTILLLLSLSFIYYFSVLNYGGDSEQYYSWVKDIYTNQGGYLSWTTAAGYNQFSIIHVYSFLIGSFSYKNPSLFFFIINLTELILLVISCLVFVKLIPNQDTKFQNIADFLIPGIVIWTMICLFQTHDHQEVLLQATDLYIMFVDSFIIISLGWFIYILNHIITKNKLPIFNLSIFIIYSTYFSITTLRFLSGAILTEIAILMLVFLNSLSLKLSQKKIKTNAKNKKNKVTTPNLICRTHSIIIFSLLIIIFIVGYFGFFMIEPYSSSARFVLRGGELTTGQAFTNMLTIINDYFSAFTNPVNAILRLIYLFITGYGAIVIFKFIFSAKKPFLEITPSEIFSLVTLINFICVTFSGLFSHGTIFLDVGAADHYYELSAIFAFLAVICLITEKFRPYNKNFIIAATTLIITSIISITYLIIKLPTLPSNRYSLLTCVAQNKKIYKLKNGMGDWLPVSLLETQDNSNTRYSIIGARATSLDYNWQRNITESIINNNFLVYTNTNYRQNALNLISAKIPSFNYQEVKCPDNSGIIVFDTSTTEDIDKFRTQEQNNSKSWFYITNYGIGQSLWSKMPWNKTFIEKHHEYIYYGSLLQKPSPNISYTINNDLSVTANGYSQQPILMTEMIHAGTGKYYLKTNYKVSTATATLVVFNLVTQQPVASANLEPGNTNQELDFQLNNTTPIIVAIINNNSEQFTLNKLIFGKYLD